MNIRYTRRLVLQAAAATGLLNAARGSANMPEFDDTLYVLVHGAWHGGWCWDDVRTQLEARGAQVLTPTLKGLGERADEMSPEIGLADHIDDIVRLIRLQDLRNVVLVGHSYGGMVITGVVDQLKEHIAHVVYLDAAVPENGQSMISYGANRSEEEVAQTRAGLAALSPDGVVMMPLPPAAFGIPEDHPRHDWVAQNLTPHPMKTWLDEIVLHNRGSTLVPRTYIHCNNPVLGMTQFPQLYAAAQSDPTWHAAIMETGHDAMITQPAELADLLREAATRTL